MKQFLLFILLVFVSDLVFSQQSDFIVLKKRNNRTLRTYYPGAFISAVTLTNFQVNGFIKDIRNDSVIIEQQEKQLFATDYGSVLDTLVYTIVIDYREIKQFNYQKNQGWGGNNGGFVQVALPKIMMIGGVGFIVLELVNTAYRGDSLDDKKKWGAIGIAAGVAAAGFLLQKAQKRDKKVGKKYKVVYIKANKKTAYLAPKHSPTNGGYK